MLVWQFQTYVTANGRNEVQSDIDRFDEHGKAALERAVAHLAITPKNEWHEPQAKKLKGNFVPALHEIRFNASRRAARAVGFFGPGDRDFTITIICFKRGQNEYDPTTALSTACQRAGYVQSGQAGVAALEIDGAPVQQDED